MEKIKLSETVPALEIVRDGYFEVLGLSNSTVFKDILTFAEDPRFFEEIIENDNITCVITKEEYVELFLESKVGIVISEKPRITFFSLHNTLASNEKYVLPQTESVVGKNCNISPLSYIDSHNVIIGDNVTIEEFVSIRGHCRIDDNVIIHSGCHIGCGGYEFKQNGESFLNVEHCGSVTIGKNVVLWPNVTVHKAVYPWDSTSIGDNTNINSRVHIDHGVKVGRRCEICAGAIISGRCILEDYSFIGPGTILSNRIEIGKNARVSIGSVVTKNVNENEVVTGNFAINHQRFLELLKEKL